MIRSQYRSPMVSPVTCSRTSPSITVLMLAYCHSVPESDEVESSMPTCASSSGFYTRSGSERCSIYHCSLGPKSAIPLVILASWRSVISSPLGTPSM